MLGLRYLDGSSWTGNYRGHATTLNAAGSAFGRNWGAKWQRRLLPTDGGALLMNCGNLDYFAGDGLGGFITPARDTSFAKLQGNWTQGFTLADKYGTVEAFNSAGLLFSSTDRNGNVTAYAYVDGNGDGMADEVSQVTGPDGRAMTLAYAAGRIQSLTDFDGRTTTFTHDAQGQLTAITETDPDGAGPLAAPVTQFGYDATTGRMTSMTDANGETTAFAYDFAGRVETITRPDQTATALRAVQGQALVDLASGTGTQNNPAPLVPAAAVAGSRTDAAGETSYYTTDRFGNLTSWTDPLGHVTSYARDAHAQVLSLTEPDPDGAGALAAPVTLFEYDSLGNLTEMTLPDGSQRLWTYEEDFSQATSHTDELGRLTLYEIDPANGNALVERRVVGEVDGEGNTETDDVVTSYAYTPLPTAQGDPPAGLVQTVTDPLGRVTAYGYNFRGQVTQATYAVGTADEASVSYEYDASANATAAVDELGRRTEYAHDALGRVSGVTQPDPDGTGPLSSPVTQYQYDAMGRVLVQIDPLNHDTQYVYDELGRVVTISRPDHDGDGQRTITTRTYTPTGLLETETDPLGRVTTYGHDEAGRQTSLTQPDPDGAGPLAAPVTTIAYDALGRLTEFTDPLGNVTSYAYENFGRRVIVTAPDPDGAGPLAPPVTTTEHDAGGNVVSVTDPLGHVTTSLNDSLGRLWKTIQPDPDGTGPLVAPVTQYGYDKAGNLTSVTDPLGKTTNYGYDDRDRKTSETDPLLGVTSYTFDDAGNLLALTDPVGNTTAWSYDNLDRVIGETNELAFTRSFSYDAVGYLTSRTDRNGRVTEFSYDSLGQRTAETWKDGQTTVRALSFSYDAAGQMLTASDPSASYVYGYDRLGRATSISQTIAGLAPTIAFSQAFDANGNRTGVAATVGGAADFANQYAYDHLGRMTRIEQSGQTGGNAVAAKRVDFAYDSAGRWDSITRYANLAGTQLVAQSSYAFDDASRLTALTHAKGGTSLAGYTWTFDTAGRITQFGSLLDGTADYSYDETDQLTGADYDYQTDEGYSYDANGNRTNTGYVTGDNNQLLSDGTYRYAYDPEGNRTARFIDVNANAVLDTGDTQITEYAWDHRNRLVSVTTRAGFGLPATQIVTFQYDVYNRLVGETVDADGAGPQAAQATYYVQDGNQIILQFNGSQAANLSHRYLWGPAVDQILADEQTTNPTTPGTVLWPLTDHLGTIRDLAQYDANTDTTTIASHRVFDAYGNLKSETNAAIDHLFGFTGRLFDEATGLQNNLNRWYDATVGRWISEDPLGYDSYDMNLSRYCRNTSTIAIDPSGFIDLPINGKWPDAVAEPGPDPSQQMMAVNAALSCLGINNVTATAGNVDKADITEADYAKIIASDEFTPCTTISGQSAQCASLEGGWELKLYVNDDGTYQAAVGNPTGSFCHLLDAILWKCAVSPNQQNATCYLRGL